MKQKTFPFLVALVLTLLSSPSFAERPFTGLLTLGGGYWAHPLGVEGDDAAGYAMQTLRLQLRESAGSSQWRLGYEGSAHQFSSDQSLDQMHHALGLEWFGLGTGRVQLSAGVQAAGRIRSGVYEPYDFTEVTGYAAFKTYLSHEWLARGFLQLRNRRYGDLPEESFLEPSAQLAIQRFLPSRTTIGATVGWGRKLYRDPSAKRVWETVDTPAASMIRLQVNAAQGLSDRASVRASVFQRWSLEGFPYLVREDLFDSPVLDAYASTGTQVAATLRILGPWQTWIEPGLSYAHWDYGELVFAGMGGVSERRDEVVLGSVALERTLRLAGFTQVKARITASWREQESSLLTYTLSGAEIFTAFSCGW